MKIFITGAAGFIGFSLANSFLNKGHRVYGIDNFDQYYSIKIKKKRLNILKKYKNFAFNKVDILNYAKLFNTINNKKIDVIIHLAAQTGVRYSIINPNKYLDVNISGFMNLIKAIKNKKINKFIYASSSSVYGDSKKFPLKENDNLNPKNIYGLSKKINEEIANLKQYNFKINFIGLRFFTIFGEWGRPDMFMFKLFKAFFLKKTFYLNNYGNHIRDFTYIGDVKKIVEKLINKNISGHHIFNVCSNKPQNILKIVQKFTKYNKTKVEMISVNKADVLKTHGNNYKIKKFIKYKKFSNFDLLFTKTFEWYKKNKIYKF
jgi:UDP-glucuronate 4-epimerase